MSILSLAKGSPWRNKTLSLSALLASLLTVFHPLPSQAASGYTAPGVTGNYYSGYWNGDPNFFSTSSPEFTRVDSRINFSDYDASLDSWQFSGTALQSQDLFSVSWEGSLMIDTAGTYEFQTLSDDGIQLFVDNTLVIYNPTIHSPTYNYGTIALAAGIVPVKVYYGENYGISVAQLSLRPPGMNDFAPIASVPGPLSILGAGAVFHHSRRLRKRVKASQLLGN